MYDKDKTAILKFLDGDRKYISGTDTYDSYHLKQMFNYTTELQTNIIPYRMDLDHGLIKIRPPKRTINAANRRLHIARMRLQNIDAAKRLISNTHLERFGSSLMSVALLAMLWVTTSYSRMLDKPGNA